LSSCSDLRDPYDSFDLAGLYRPDLVLQIIAVVDSSMPIFVDEELEDTAGLRDAKCRHC
jgi:hypothetical protein